VAATTLIGTCGWTDKTLLDSGAFYPPGTDTAEERLRYYADQFSIVEVDSTYYGPPSEKTAGLWVQRTPPGFTFDIKAYRLLTQHPTPPRTLWKDLREQLPPDQAEKRNVYARDLPREFVEEAFHRFSEALMPLHSAGKLGTILLQFPPYVGPSRGAYGYLAWAAERLSEFDVAVEFRQGTWMDESHADSTLGLLRDHQLSYVCVDEPQGFRSSVPPVVAVTSPISVVRFHGRNIGNWERKGISAAERFRYDYREEELRDWLPGIDRLREETGEVHLLMNNCYGDYAIRSARLLAGLLEGEAGLGV
jgi:uncharacterized protein YecE (DUF72 family)